MSKIIDGNDLARKCYRNYEGVIYAAGDHQWPTGAPSGWEILEETRAMLAPLGIELDTRRAELEYHCRRVVEFRGYFSPGNALLVEAETKKAHLLAELDLRAIEIDKSLIGRIYGLVWEGIRVGTKSAPDQAEGLDAHKAQRQMEELRLFAAARSVSALLRDSEWDELREVVREAGQPADPFQWDEAVLVTAAP